jgi:hypothetical protein
MSPPPRVIISRGDDGGVSCQNPVIAEGPAIELIFLRSTLLDCHIGAVAGTEP